VSLRVTVAALGPTADIVFQSSGSLRSFTGPGWQDQGPDLRWDEREKVELNVDESDTLASVIDQAAAELGIGVPNRPLTWPYTQNLVSASISNGVAFYKPADDEPAGYQGPFLTLFPTMSESGEIGWRTLDRTTMGDLVRASDAGLLPGDPLKPYLNPMISQGGGPADFGDPAMLFEAIKHFLHALEMVGEVYGGVAAVRAVLRRLGPAESVDEQALITRNAGAEELNELLRHYRDLTLPVLARALAADEEAAKGIAELLGYDVQADGAIVYSREPDAEFVRALPGVASLRRLHGARGGGEDHHPVRRGTAASARGGPARGRERLEARVDRGEPERVRLGAGRTGGDG
jgi:hypothetical protein